MTSMTMTDERMWRPGSMANLHAALDACPTLDAAARILSRDIEEHSGLDAETRELVFLRVARLRHSEYCWHNHALEARRLGLADAEITALEHWRSSERVRFDARQRAVLGYVDALVRGGPVNETTRRVLESELSLGEIVGLTMLTGLAWTEAAMAAGRALPTEEPFIGWELYRGVASVSL
ncbi:MAG: carboxymuconolactone decarboxylase family protein [Dehalococcoidia bacterium]